MSKQEYDTQKLKPRGSDPNGQTRHHLPLLLCLFLCLHTNAQTPINYLHEARSAEKWIRSLQQQDNTGVYWPNIKDSSHHSLDLYSGNSGIILFYISLYQSTHRSEYLSIAQRAADRMINELSGKWNEETVGLYTGAAGIAYTLHRVFIATKNRKYLQHARELAKATLQEFFQNNSFPDHYWFNAVLLRGYLELYKIDRNSTYLDVFRRYGEHIWEKERDPINNLIGRNNIKELLDQAAVMEIYARLAMVATR